MRPDYGWWLVAGIFIVLTISSGFGFYNLAVYMNALAQQRGFAVTDVSGAVGLLFIVGGVAGLGVARLIAVYDARWIMIGGAAIGGVSLSLIGQAQDVWQIWLLYAIFGIGNAGVSLIPGTTLVTRWFPGANRSVALSIASTGLSTGGVVLTPICAYVVHNFGIGIAMPWFGAVFFLAIAPIALLMVRSWPDGERPAARTGADSSVRAALVSRFFIGTSAAYVLVMGSQVGAIAHIFNHADKVAGQVVASSAVATLAMLSIIGRLVGGFIVARFPIRAFTLLNVVGQCVGLAIVAFADTGATVLVGAGTLGLTVGNLLMLQPLLMAEAFGVRDYPRIFSVANLTMTIGVAGGPLLMGMLYDAYAYPIAFLTAAVLSLIAFFVFFSAGALPLRDEVQGRSTFRRDLAS